MGLAGQPRKIVDLEVPPLFAVTTPSLPSHLSGDVFNNAATTCHSLSNLSLLVFLDSRDSHDLIDKAGCGPGREQNYPSLSSFSSKVLEYLQA